MSKREWLGAALAAFGVGCGEGNEGRGTRDEGDIKDAKVEKAIENVAGMDEVIDEELVVREEDVAGKVEMGDGRWERKKMGEAVEKWNAKEMMESEPMAFRNVLMEEADGIRPGKWMGDEYDDEVKRLKEKLLRELWEKKFDGSVEQLHKFFAPRKDEEKEGVICLLKMTKDKKFFVNKEYREQVKTFVEKYGAKYNVPVEIIYSVIAVENAGKHDPRKNKADGAYGIMQVQPGVVKHLAEMKFKGEDWDDVSVADLEGNIRAGAAYLAYLYGRYGQWSFALMAYNSGPGRFENRMAGGEKEKSKIRKERGWKKWLEDKNFWWACSRNGRAFVENGNAGYAADAMYLGKPLGEIMRLQGGEVKLTPLTDDMK